MNPSYSLNKLSARLNINQFDSQMLQDSDYNVLTVRREKKHPMPCSCFLFFTAATREDNEFRLITVHPIQLTASVQEKVESFVVDAKFNDQVSTIPTNDWSIPQKLEFKHTPNTCQSLAHTTMTSHVHPT